VTVECPHDNIVEVDDLMDEEGEEVLIPAHDICTDCGKEFH